MLAPYPRWLARGVVVSTGKVNLSMVDGFAHSAVGYFEGLRARHIDTIMGAELTLWEGINTLWQKRQPTAVELLPTVEVTNPIGGRYCHVYQGRNTG